MNRSTFRTTFVATALAALAACSGTATRDAALAEADEAAREAQEVAEMGSYWSHRASYPTGEFSSAWQVEAAKQEALVRRALPDGAMRSALEAPTALDPVNFTPLGPRPLISGAATAGRTNVIITHPTDPTIAWIGTDGGGVWKTTNCCSASTTWTLKTDIPQIQNSAIGEMEIDPNNPNVLYAGTGDLRFGSFSFGSNGVLKSTDGGETWTVKGETVFNPIYTPPAGAPPFPQYQAIGQIEVDPNDSQKVIVGTKTGLYLSYDGGDNWTGPCLANSFTTQRQDTTGLVLRDLGTTTQMIVAIGTRGFQTTVQPDLNQNGANGIYRGTVPATSGCPTDFITVSRADNGWPAGTAEGTPTPTNTLGRVDIANAPTDDQVVYAQVARVNSASPDILGIWRSANAGDTWTQVVTGNITGTGTQSWYNAGMTVSPTDANVVLLSAFRTFRSVNGGSTWTSTGTAPHVDHHARAFVANDPNQALIGTDGGVWYSSNAQAASPTWTSLNSTLNTIELYSGGLTPNFATSATSGAVAGAQDNSCMVSTWTGGNFTAQAWNVRNGGDGFWSTVEPILGQRWYYSSQNGAIVATTTAQATGASSAQPSGWTADRKTFVTFFDLYRWTQDVAACVPTCGRIITGSYRIWESITGGQPTSSWVSNSPDLTKNTLADRSFINQVAYSFSSSAIAIAGTNDGNVWIGTNLGQGVADSATWINVTDSNAVLPNRPIMDVGTGVDPFVGYAAVGGFNENTPTRPGHAFQVRCAVNCTSFTWRDITGNLPNVPANSIIVNPNIERQVFVGTDWGLYFTDNVEANPVVWQKHAGLPNVMIWDMALDRGFTTLAVFTRSRGAWVWPLPTRPDALFSDGFE